MSQLSEQRLSVVALVGRPNVGKSALFNRIRGQRVAIVQDEPGVTRDRIVERCEWLGRAFMLVDTGGIDMGAVELGAQVRAQAQIAAEEADLILFVVDARAGVTPADREVADFLRRVGKPVLLVANKVEASEQEVAAAEFWNLGLDAPILVSAEHGRNIGDLLDLVLEGLPAQAADEESERIKVAIIGRPNVGKSSLVNALLGEERVIVADLPGTTRDAIDTPFARNDRAYTIIDTAGLRRKSRVEAGVERYSVVRALSAVERADVCVAVLDATAGVIEQDKKIIGYADECGRGLIIAVNKWDALEKTGSTMHELDAQIRAALPFAAYAPITFISAKARIRLDEVLDLVDYVAEQQALRISTGRFNEVLQEAVMLRPPPADKGVALRIKYGFQSQVKPPTFVLFVNRPDLMHYSYERYLENRLRETFGFVGTPMRFAVKGR